MPRQTRWVDTLLATTVASGAQGNIPLLGELTTRHRSTITRLILCYRVYPAVPRVVSGIQHVDVGIGVIQQEAATANIVPDPVAEGDFPSMGWLYRCRHSVFDEASGAVIELNMEVMRDLKSQRVLGQDADLRFITDNTALQGSSFSIRVSGIVRTLVKLP